MAATLAWQEPDLQLPWFTYGDRELLLADEKAAVADFKGKGFAVTEKVVPNAGHCAFDAHGEAVGIWTQNP
jgi:hypothetical protein